MNMRKAFKALLITLLFVLALPLTALALDETAAVTMRKTGKQAYLYYVESGEKVTGGSGVMELPKGSGNWYSFKNTEGRVSAVTWVRKGKTTYYATSKGTLATGWYKKGKYTYYFRPDNAKMVKGWYTIDGVRYNFNKKNGRMQSGWVVSGKHTYYVDTKGGKVTGWAKIGKKYYFFNEKGWLQKGLFTVNGRLYYSTDKGERKTGLVRVGSATYYFTKNGASTGWKTVKKKKYFFRSSGKNKYEAVTGWLNLGGKNYYFNNSGVMQKGWLVIGTKKYYLDPSTGAMATGTIKIGGKSYNLGKNGYVSVNLNSSNPADWSVRVNLSTCITTVYLRGEAVYAMYCSPAADGVSTPRGTFSLKDKLRWHTLNGPSYGQWCSHLTADILFHSVWYYQQNPTTMADQEYYKLGRPASHGCIRLAARDAYWLYTHCPIGTKVTIGDYGKSDPMPAAALPNIRKSGIDPTDPFTAS